ARITLPSGALLIVNANGTFDYDPNHKFDYLPTPDSGASNLTVTDTFSYTITGGDTATVTVTVHGVDTDDVLYDSGDTDNLAGGIGNDVYYVSNTGDVVTEAANAGSDTVAAFVNYTLPANNTVEVLNMIGAGLTGTGTDGAETFISSSGPNTLIGLGGNDTYYVNHADDDVIEAPDGGVDTVLASVDYTMPADAEGLYMMGSGLTGMGTNNADSLLSSGGPNTLVGLDGDDLYYVNNAADVVVEVPNEGFDSVITSLSYDLSANAANVEALYLTGSGLTGTGNSDANTLVNAGANTLTGGDGNDTFVFSAGSANGATVTDFNRDQVTEWDFLVFSGFGTQGATFSQIGTTDQWQIHSGLDGHNETITLSNHAVVHAGDFVFV
ncbi:MAG TPA: VCBS domain-containing protein, partial [Mycobacterium sp.]|nr:VCBS domain-containing protein [Mycobacterium sp.]